MLDLEVCLCAMWMCTGDREAELSVLWGYEICVVHDGNWDLNFAHLIFGVGVLLRSIYVICRNGTPIFSSLKTF